MATLSIVQRALGRGAVPFRPRTVLAVGTGDGSLMLGLARRQAARWPGIRLTLLDQTNTVAPGTIDELRELGWEPRVVAADVFAWLERSDDARWDIVVADRFVHRFAPAALGRLLRGLAARSRVFLCCEPRRSTLPLSVLLGSGPGPGALARVRAGFRARELSALWPDPQAWDLEEYAAGLSSHCLLALRQGPE